MGIRNIAVTITGDGSSLARALLRGGQEVDQFARKVDTSNARAALSWKTAGLAAGAAVTAIAVGMAASAVAAAQFETRMRNVNSILHVNDAEFRALSASTLDLSRKLPQSANTLAEGLYDIASSGFAGADGLLVLEKSAQAASAGLTTTQNAAQAIAAVLNAYGLSAASAGDVSDTLFQTVNLGVVSFEALSGVIGSVVGTAAAAKVDIAQVGSAIATMTLSGISADEAGTSLNRVLQSLIQPSEALTALFGQLGYESGAAALESKGLAGVLDDIRVATGGNITSLLQLFPEIRAARGALALMGDEGRTYARVTKGIEDENARLGATQKALDEQMKASSAQLRLFMNGARAEAIVLGTKVLPTFVMTLEVMRDLGSEAMPLLAAGVSALTPLFAALYATGQNVAEILATLWEAIEPVTAGLLAIAGTVILTGLNALGRTLQGVTGFLAEHKQIVLLLASVYAASLLPSVAALTIAFNRFILTPVLLGLSSLIGAAGAGAGALRALTVAMVSFQAVATLGIGVAIYGVTRAFGGMSRAQDQAREGFQGLVNDFDALDTGKAIDNLLTLQDQMLKSQQTVNSYSGFWGTLRAAADNAFGDQTQKNASASVQATADAILTLAAQADNARANLEQLASSTGLSVEELAKLARQQNIDLTKPYEDSADARKQVLMYLRDLEKQSGTTLHALQTNAGADLESIQALAKAIEDLKKKAASAFGRDTDVLGSFDPQAGADEVQSATERVKDAEKALADTRARQAADAKKGVGDVITVRKAEEAVSEARADLAKAREARQQNTLAASYRRQIALGTEFSKDLQQAVKRGLDPTVAARLLEEGPAQAGPILDQILADHSGRLIKMVNDGEKALAKLNVAVVEQARLTALAVNSTTDELSRNLATGMRISAEVLAEGAKATVESVAKKLGLPTAEVQRIAEMYGITLVGAVQRGMNQAPPLQLPNAVTVVPGQGASGTGRAGFAGGGLAMGPGTATSDSLLARLSNGEYVHRAAAVRFYGVEFMTRLNNLQLPRYADGGYVGAERMAAAARTAGSSAGMSTSDVARTAAALAAMAPRHTTHQNTFERVSSYEEVMRKARAAESLSNLLGGV